MKFALATMLVFALGLLVTPAMAADNTSFHALNQVTIDQSTTAMSDAELAKIEGQGTNICQICVNYSNISQRNRNTQVNVLGLGQKNYSSQSNLAVVVQSIN